MITITCLISIFFLGNHFIPKIPRYETKNVIIDFSDYDECVKFRDDGYGTINYIWCGNHSEECPQCTTEKVVEYYNIKYIYCDEEYGWESECHIKYKERIK